MFWKLINKLKSIEKKTWIRNSFLLPILFVVIISISHTVTWYDIGNPLSWAMYLSVAIEVFALASISAASINVSRGSIWFLFGIVTFIQMIGNIFFSFNDINANGQLFKSWVELIQPLFEDWDQMDHRRLLAAIQGGSLPIMSLTALHFYLKSNEKEDIKPELIEPVVVPVPEPVVVVPEPIKPQKVDPTDPNQPFWKGHVPSKPKEDIKPTEADDDMAKFNPQE